MDQVELARIRSVSSMSFSAGDWKDSARLMIEQLANRGVTQLEINSLWQEMVQEVESLHILSRSVSVILSQCTLQWIQRDGMDEDEAAMNRIWADTEEMDRALPATTAVTSGGTMAKVHSFCISAECAF